MCVGPDRWVCRGFPYNLVPLISPARLRQRCRGKIIIICDLAHFSSWPCIFTAPDPSAPERRVSPDSAQRTQPSIRDCALVVASTRSQWRPWVTRIRATRGQPPWTRRMRPAELSTSGTLMPRIYSRRTPTPPAMRHGVFCIFLPVGHGGSQRASQNTDSFAQLQLPCFSVHLHIEIGLGLSLPVVFGLLGGLGTDAFLLALK